MADLHTLPRSALPEGWYEGTFSGEWHREGHRVGDWTSLLSVYQHGGGRSYTACYGDAGDGCVSVYLPDIFRTRKEAIAAAEAAYCGCRIRKEQA